MSLLGAVLAHFTNVNVDQNIVNEAWTIFNNPDSSSELPWLRRHDESNAEENAADQKSLEAQLCVQTDAQYVDFYSSWDNSDLAVLVHNKDTEIEKLEKELQQQKDHLKRVIAYRDKQLEKTKQELSLVEQELQMAQALQREAPKKWVSRLGGYTLAIRRNYGHTGAAAAAKMIQGEHACGTKTINIFEHRAACAKRLLTKNDYELHEQLVQSSTVESTDSGIETPSSAASSTETTTTFKPTIYDLEVHLYKGDATQEEAIERKKLHAGFTASIAQSQSSLKEFVTKIEAELAAEAAKDAEKKAQKATASSASSVPDGLEGFLPSDLDGDDEDELQIVEIGKSVKNMDMHLDMDTHCCCDLQDVIRSTGEETYMLVDREMTSVGCKSWEVRASQAHLHPNRLSCYAFGLDAGPDNQGMTRRIMSRLKGIKLVMMWVIYCLLHQGHLIVKYILKTCEEFEWPTRFAMKKGYYSSLATLANTWRSTGGPRCVQNAASSLFSDEVMVRLFKKIPGNI